MKKTLALVLSLALAVALCVGLFVISSSAAEKSYAETKAEELWAEANKATALKITVNGVVVEVTEALEDKAMTEIFKDVALVAEDKKATDSVEIGGKVTFKNGELTISGVYAKKTVTAEGADPVVSNVSILFNGNGGMKVLIKDADFYGQIQNHNYGKDPDGKVIACPDNSHLLVTSDGHTLTGGGNTLRAGPGALVVYGNIALDLNAGGGYDCVIIDASQSIRETAAGAVDSYYPLILGPELPSRLAANGNGPMVDQRRGDLVVCEGVHLTCVGRPDVTKNGNHALTVTNAAKAGATLTVQDKATIIIDSNGKGLVNAKVGGALVLEGNPFIYHKAPSLCSWGSTLEGSSVKISGGTVVADYVMAQAAAAAITVTGGANNQETVISGGKFFFNIDGTDNGTRATGMLFKGAAKVNFNGGDFYINMIDKAGNSPSDGVIRTQNGTGVPAEINFAGANFKIKATGAETHMFRCEQASTAINFTGGSVEATVDGNLFDLQAAAIAIPVTVGADAKVSITCGAQNNLSKGSFTIDGVAGTVDTKEIKKGTVIAMAETAPAFAAPANVKASDVTKDSAKVTWDAVKGAKAYAVTLNGVQLDPVTTNEIAIADLVPSLKCTVTVTALYTDNIATEAATVEFTTEAGEATGPVVGAPTDLKVVAVNSKKAVLSWTPVEGAVAYSIYVNGEPVMDGEAVKQISETTYVINKSADVALTSWSLLGETEKSAALKVTLEDPAKLPYFVEVTTADGTLVYLTKDNASIEGVTYDAATGTITLNNATIRGISATGRLTIVAKGTNTVGTGNEGRIFDADDLIFEGDGKIVVDANVSNYPVYACSLIVFQGSINFELNGGDKVSSAIHPGRGTNDTRGGTGDTGVIFREKATVVLNVPTGMGLNIVGLRPKLISTDMAKVTINGNTKSDAARVIADTANASDVDLSKGASSYTEFSGKTEFTITMGNCGFRNQVTVDTSAEAVKSVLFNKPTSVEFIVKGYAKVDVTAPGQTVYLRNDGAKNDAEVIDVVTLKVTENGSLKITNIGPASNGSDYQCIQINTDEANFIIDGGSIEMIKGCDESALADGKKRVGIMSVPTTTKYTIGANATTYVFGKDAENAKTQTKVQAGAYYGKIAFAENTSVKYVASNFNDMGLDFFTLNNKTSDVNVLPFAAMSVLALVGLAAVVVLRKKFN